MIRRKAFHSKKRRGAATVFVVGVAFAILMIASVILELMNMYEYHFAIYTRGQSAVNTVVEHSMDDRWRSDGYNIMDVGDAQRDYIAILNENLNVDANGYCKDDRGQTLYKVTYGQPTFVEGTPYGNPQASMKIDIKVDMAVGLVRAFDIDGYNTWTTTFSSTNYRTDDTMIAR